MLPKHPHITKPTHTHTHTLQPPPPPTHTHTLQNTGKIAVRVRFVGLRCVSKNIKQCVIHIHNREAAGSGLRLQLFRRCRIRAYDDVIRNKWEILSVSIREEVLERVLKF
jgi:hypothetical protein